MDYPDFTGALLDLRPLKEKEKDFNHEEIGGDAPVEWEYKPFSEMRYFDRRDQQYSSSCGAQSAAKTLGIENHKETGEFVTISAREIYLSRSNYPEGGMYLQELLKFCCEAKGCLESQLLSQGIGEMEMDEKISFTDAMTASAEKFKAGGYVQMSTDMDKVASVVQGGKGVVVLMYFTSEEYWRPQPYIKERFLKKHDSNASRHFVVVTDFFRLLDGRRAFVVEDSAGNSSSIEGKGQRIITEDFWNTRAIACGYLLDLSNDPEKRKEPKPDIDIIHTLKKGSVYTEEVKNLQDLLRWAGYFPAKQVSTGVFGNITLKGVRDFQTAHNLKVDGIVGNKTLLALTTL